MSLISTNDCSVSELLLQKIKTFLLLTLFTLSFTNVFAQGVTVDSCDDFVTGPNATWTHVLVATTVADGAASQAAQTFTMNVTSLPAGGANFRVYKTTANGGDFFGNPIALTLGSNSITVGAVGFDRAVKFQFSSGAIEFDALSLNGVDTECIAPIPPPPTSLISDCDDFVSGPAAWPYVLVATTVAEGAASQAAQTFTMNVTSLPAGGANVRVYKTTANGNDFFATPVALTLGSNSITVAAVSFDRAVKFQFSSGDVEFDALSLNGADSDCAFAVPPPISLISDCDDFVSGPAAWPYVLVATTVADGAASQAAQTFTMNVTSLPAGGATFRVYKTTANGSDFFGNPQTMTLGSNSITVGAVGFDRAVKFQFSSGDVEFDALSLNGVDSDCVGAATPILGCTDAAADNYDASATQDDGSCNYTILGCTDAAASNYDSAANTDDGSCLYAVTFTVDMNCYADAFTTVYVTGPFAGWCGDCFPLSDADGDGVWEGTYDFVAGDLEYKYNVDNWAHQEDLIDDMVNGGSCAPVTDYWSFANRLVTVAGVTVTDDNYGSCDDCVPAVLGCTDPNAENYDSSADTDDGSCCFDNLVAWSAGGGSFTSEVGWSIVDANGTVIASGGAPASGDICLPDGCYSLDMTDSWGDGWNGNTFTIDGQVLGTGFTGGSTFSETFCLGVCCWLY